MVITNSLNVWGDLYTSMLPPTNIDVIPTHWQAIQFIMVGIIRCRYPFNNTYLNNRINWNIFLSSNISGPVDGRQDSCHSKLYAVLQCLKSIPNNLFNQVCICVDELWVTTFLAQHLPEISENSFRSVYTGKLTNDLETNMAINTLIRSRTDLKLRVKYIPIKIGVADMNFARDLAIDAAKKAGPRANIDD